MVNDTSSLFMVSNGTLSSTLIGWSDDFMPTHHDIIQIAVLVIPSLVISILLALRDQGVETVNFGATDIDNSLPANTPSMSANDLAPLAQTLQSTNSTTTAIDGTGAATPVEEVNGYSYPPNPNVPVDYITPIIDRGKNTYITTRAASTNGPEPPSPDTPGSVANTDVSDITDPSYFPSDISRVSATSTTSSVWSLIKREDRKGYITAFKQFLKDCRQGMEVWEDNGGGDTTPTVGAVPRKAMPSNSTNSSISSYGTNNKGGDEQSHLLTCKVSQRLTKKELIIGYDQKTNSCSLKWKKEDWRTKLLRYLHFSSKWERNSREVTITAIKDPLVFCETHMDKYNNPAETIKTFYGFTIAWPPSPSAAAKSAGGNASKRSGSGEILNLYVPAADNSNAAKRRDMKLGLLKEFFKNPGLKRGNSWEHLPTIDEEYSSINGAKSAGGAQK